MREVAGGYLFGCRRIIWGSRSFAMHSPSGNGHKAAGVHKVESVDAGQWGRVVGVSMSSWVLLTGRSYDNVFSNVLIKKI